MTLDEFEIRELLGKGSYAQVYLAEGENGPLALKLLRSNLVSPQMCGRFRREAELLEQAKGHPNIVEIQTEVREAQGSLYYGMENLPPEHLEARLHKEPPTQAEILKIMIGVCKGLQRVHELGFLHRDLCLRNVLVAQNGEAKLIDLGLSKPFEEETGLTPDFWFAHGDPETAAPERLFQIESGEAGDAWSVGCLLYSLCTRRSIFRLSSLSFLYSTYTRQMEQFFKTCMGHGLPCPQVDFRSVYDHYLETAQVPSFEQRDMSSSLSPDVYQGLSEILGDLLQPDYWKRLNVFGTLAAVSARLEELAAL